jgi:hypothetical protein
MKPYSSFKLGTSSGRVGQCHAPIALLLGETAGIHCTGGWSALGTVWAGPENFASTRIQSLDRSARSERLYRLNCLTGLAWLRTGLIISDLRKTMIKEKTCKLFSSVTKSCIHFPMLFRNSKTFSKSIIATPHITVILNSTAVKTSNFSNYKT